MDEYLLEKAREKSKKSSENLNYSDLDVEDQKLFNKCEFVIGAIQKYLIQQNLYITPNIFIEIYRNPKFEAKFISYMFAMDCDSIDAMEQSIEDFVKISSKEFPDFVYYIVTCLIRIIAEILPINLLPSHFAWNFIICENLNTNSQIKMMQDVLKRMHKKQLILLCRFVDLIGRTNQHFESKNFYRKSNTRTISKNTIYALVPNILTIYLNSLPIEVRSEIYSVEKYSIIPEYSEICYTVIEISQRLEESFAFLIKHRGDILKVMCETREMNLFVEKFDEIKQRVSSTSKR